MAAYPGARRHQWDPQHADGAVAGLRAAFDAGGADVAPVYDLSRADVVVSFGADFTNAGPGRLRYAKDFARRRRVRSAEDEMNRLWMVETTPTPTGTLADHRKALAPADVAAFAAWVAAQVGVADAPGADLPARVERAWADALVADLQGARGRGAVFAGPDQPAVVHALAHALNHALDNVGATVRYVAHPVAAPTVHANDLAELVADLRAGAVDVLVILGANPAHTAPADLEFPTAMARAALSVHVGEHLDETGRAATWHVPRTHALETWGDARAFDGTITIQQPLFAPFYGGKSDLEVIAGAARSRRPERVRRRPLGVASARQRRLRGLLAARALPRRPRELGRPVGGGGAAPDRPAPAAPRRTWSCTSTSTTGSATAATPTTAGSRSCRAPSPS